MTSLRERYSQGKSSQNNKSTFLFHPQPLICIEQGQSSARELKNENHFLRDYVHRLNATISEYQALNPPDALKKDQRKQQSLPMKGPTPIWLVRITFSSSITIRLFIFIAQSKIPRTIIRLLR